MKTLPIKHYVFVGPTSYCREKGIATYKDIIVCSPVKRGDIDIIVNSEKEPGIISIVDGVFHNSLSVGHAELRRALAKGWNVWGLSSMGAIRAYEMRHMGMHGFGQVYQQFLENEDFRDDEVALLHAPMPPYYPLSEPLVHIREFLVFLTREEVICNQERSEIEAKVSSIWFGYRTLDCLTELIYTITEFDHSYKHRIETLLSRFDSFRVKSRDLDNYLEQQPWKRLANQEFQ